jgi:rRNA maturation protein Nop10
MKHILRTESGKFTMQENLEGEKAVTTKPPRYSPDKYAKYRKEARKEELISKGFL